MTPGEAVAELVQTPVTGVVAIGSEVWEVDLACGEFGCADGSGWGVGGGTVVAKRHGHPSQVAAEVGGLAWLAEAAAAPVPGVRAFDGAWVVMDLVEPGEPGVAAAERLGRDLAALHAAGADAFGAGPTVDAWIGKAPMRNAPAARWPRWYAEERLLPYLRLAVDAGALDAAPFEAVCARVDELAGPPEPPARLHGDLWNGNVLWAADGRAWLIDPAAHGGHRETDLAMLALFGCPHLDVVLAAYDEVAPLAAGWRARVALHQLFPLLVHVALFGGGYARQALAAARAALTG